MITYFVNRNVADGLPAADFKSINSAANNLFEGGHIQNIEIGKSEECIFIRSNCLPEMRKDRVYKVVISLHKDSFDVVTACCGCPAGKGPTASCKHIGAVCYAVVSFCTLKRLPDFATPTEKLQEWNRPRPRKVEPIPVTELSERRREIKKKENVFSLKYFNPQPPEIQVDQPRLLENMRIALLEQNSAFSQLLVAPVSVALKDHTYHACEGSSLPLPQSQLPVANESLELILGNFIPSNFTKDSLNVTAEEREKIEVITRDQSQSAQWYIARCRRITGSTCGKILIQHAPTPALLSAVLYSKPFITPPPPIKWGLEHEMQASRAYLEYAKRHGKHKLAIRKCGFVIHPTMGFFGASPDACVTDPYCELPEGIAEYKCPFSKKDVTPREACEDESFYCTYLGGSFHLKRNHHYYHQVQLQLYVGMDLYGWCDFCVFTLKGIEVERIYLDVDWCNIHITELESYFDAYMLPEIVSPTHKPSYVLQHNHLTKHELTTQRRMKISEHGTHKKHLLCHFCQ